MRVLTILLILLLAGCNKQTPESRQINQVENERLFKECMELAAKLPTHTNDANNNIIDDCNSRAFWRSQ